MRTDVIYCGDCLRGLGRLPEGCAQVVFTSPPYPGRRPGRIPPGEYLPWLVERAFAVKRVLAERGNFFLNLDDCVVRGEEAAVPQKVVLALKEVVGLKLIATYHWTKPNALPGAYGPRLKNAHEYVFHFARTVRPRVYLEALGRAYRRGRPAPELGAGGETSKRPSTSATKPGKSKVTESRRSGRVVDESRMFRRGWADPGNVFRIPVGGERSEHPTPMPVGLARAFILLGSAPGDLVVDPFSGGGTTLVAARELGRHYVGFEVEPEYARAARRRLREARPPSTVETPRRPRSEPSRPPEGSEG